jgi:hypothetical protein
VCRGLFCFEDLFAACEGARGAAEPAAARNQVLAPLADGESFLLAEAVNFAVRHVHLGADGRGADKQIVTDAVLRRWLVVRIVVHDDVIPLSRKRDVVLGS